MNTRSRQSPGQGRSARGSAAAAAWLLAAGLAALLFAACSTLGGVASAKPAPPAATASAKPGPVPAPPLPPPPVPAAPPDLSLYRTGKIDQRVRLVRENLEAAAFRNPGAGLKDLTLALVSQEKDPFMKIKLIHDWICRNISYDVDMLRSQYAVDQDVDHVMASRRAVCSGYSRLFQAMAGYAGFLCATASGFAKNQSGSRGLAPANSHAWNIVTVGGSRYIVDTTFDSGYVEGDLFVRHYSTDDLFPDPRSSIYERYPKQDEFQLLAKPLSEKEFLDSADLEGSFFALGLESPGNALAWNLRAKGAFALELRASRPDLVLDAAIYGPDGAEIGRGAMVQKPQPRRWRLLFAMRKPGLHKVELYAKRADEKRFDYLVPASEFEGKLLPSLKSLAAKGAISGADLDLVVSGFERIPSRKLYRFAEDPFDQARTDRICALLGKADFSTGSLRKVAAFTLNNEQGAASPLFPTFYAQYQNALADSLIEPLEGDLRAGDTASFAYRAPDAANAMLVAGGTQYPLVKGSDGVFRGEIVLPQGGEVKLATSVNDADYWVAAAWTIRPR